MTSTSITQLRAEYLYSQNPTLPCHCPSFPTKLPFMSMSATDSMQKHQQLSPDRISSLPDTILSHILSFLPTKSAIATTILSPRWKSLWKYTSTLDFNFAFDERNDVSIFTRRYCQSYNLLGFIRFVNRTLHLHDSKRIDKFSLVISSSFILYNVNLRDAMTDWVEASVARKVKNLVINSCFNIKQLRSMNVWFGRFQLPCCVYTCKTIEVLYLRGVVNLNPLGVVCLPNLHTLYLEEVEFGCGESVDRLLSGCSSLKSLYVTRGGYDNVVVFKIHSSTLEHLKIHTFGHGKKVKDEVFRLELHAPGLKYFNLNDNVFDEISLDVLTSLVEADISLNSQFLPSQSGQNWWNDIENLCRRLCNVKVLSLNKVAAKALSLSGFSPMFHRLTNLTLEACCCEWSSLLDLFRFSESLETITLNIYFKEHPRMTRYWAKPEKVPDGLSLLKKMLIQGFAGRDDELAMVRYVLNNARLLETMEITIVDYYLNLIEKQQLRQQVSKMSRLSKMCEVIFP